MPEVAPVMTTVLPCMTDSADLRGAYQPDDIEIAEEECDLVRRGLRRVRAVHRIGFDRFGEVLADRAGRGIGGIGGAHHFAVLGDGVLAFQHLHDDRARRS